MQRSIQSNQRKVRVIAFRIEGSTGTPTVEGIDAAQVSIVDTDVGTYTITFLNPFAVAAHVTANAEAVDQAITVTATKSGCVIKVNAIDETAALADGDVQVIVIGSDVSERY